LNFATDTGWPDSSCNLREKQIPPTLSPEQLSIHFPQLEIIELLGRGGMGVVYKARQKSLGRLIALKLLAPERAEDPEFAHRFTQEARALAALNHPNIVTIHDFGQAGGFYYLLMEFVDGVNLRQALRAGRLEPEQALAIVPPICEALQYAHDHQIVHRDIKPENLLLNKEGRIKIADFGIARILGDDVTVNIAESHPAGTPQYMAPEQKLHLRTDHRADIYSLGVVLYEMLTGELPATQITPPSKRVQVDVRIDEIVLRALESRPELRFPTANAFRDQIQTVTWLPATGNSLNPSNLRFSRAALIGAFWLAASIIAFIIVLLGWYSMRVGASGHSTHRPTVARWMVLSPSLVLFIIGPIVTTILGWRAIHQIRTSNGRIRGMGLAIFIALVYPLMALGGVTALAFTALAKMLVDFYGNPAAVSSQHATVVTRLANWIAINTEVVVLFAVGLGTLVCILVLRSVRSAVARPVASPAEMRSMPSETHEPTIASVALLLALISFAIGCLCAMWPEDGSFLMILLSLFMASQAILMSIPMRRTSLGKVAIVIAGLSIAIWPLVIAATATIRSQTATAYQPPMSPQRGYPTGAHIGRNHRSLLVVHDQVDLVLHYVLFYEGSFSTSSSGTQNLATNTWTDEGGIRLENGISFGYIRRAMSPDELVVNGTNWNLEYGRVFVLGRDGKVLQLPMFPSVETASDPDVLAERIALHQKVGQSNPQLPAPDHIDFRVQRVENVAGSRKIVIHFERDDRFGLGLEFSQDVIGSADEKMPRQGYRDFRQKVFLGVKDARQFTWELPEEFDLHDTAMAAKSVAEQAKIHSKIPDGALIEFARVKHTEGWTYILLARVVHEQTPISVSENKVRKHNEWSPEMLELASKVALSRSVGSSLPEDLIQWGARQDDLQAGILMPSIVAEGGQAEARLVLRNVSVTHSSQNQQINALSLHLVTYNAIGKSRNKPIAARRSLPRYQALVTLAPGEQIEFESWNIQFGGTTDPSDRDGTVVSSAPGITVVKLLLDREDGSALETGEVSVLVNDKYASRSTVTHGLAFPLRNQLARNMEVALRQVLRGRPIQDAEASPDDKTIFVVAYNDVMRRVNSFITVNDASDTLVRDDDFHYPTYSQLVTARSFLHACAIEDDDRAIANLLSVGVLAELQGVQTQPYLEFKKTGVIDPHWESELRDDWPSKRAAIRRLRDEWNRFALIGLEELPSSEASSQGTPKIKASFADAPVAHCELKVVRSTSQPNELEAAYCIDSLPPWWNTEPILKPSPHVSSPSVDPKIQAASAMGMKATLSDFRLKLESLQSQLARGPVRDDLSPDEKAVWRTKMEMEIESVGKAITSLEKELQQVDGSKEGDR
jgi:predicted Ser/Thr protein kinase